MVELTSEEQSYLRRLLEIEENGGSVDEHIARRLYGELSEAARIERENVRGGRRHDYLVALFSVVSGAVAGFFGGTYGHGLIAIIRSWLGL